MGFVTDLPPQMVLDEVRRVPEIFTSLKLVVDRDRQPGLFLLTCSADVLLLPKLADSLAGRIEVLRLHPLAQVELRKQEACFLAQLFSADFKLASFQRMGVGLAELVVAGGFPAALTRQNARRRAWYQAYVQTLIQHDVRDLARIAALDAASLHANRALLGQLLETFVFQELRRQASASPEAVAFYHFRNRDDHEVDIVLERGAVLAGVEVKASGTVRNQDFRGLRKLQEIAGERFACGVVLYDGEASLRFGPRLFALPVQTLWGNKTEAGFAWTGA